jgi:hypothetical protein
MMAQDLLTPFDNPVADEASAGSNDMNGPGELLGERESPSPVLNPFDQAVAAKSGTEETGGKMKTSRFANTPHGGASEIGLSQALNVTGSPKAG